MPAVLREAAERRPVPTLAGVHAAIHSALALDAARAVWQASPTAIERYAKDTYAAFEAFEATVGWPRFRTTDGMVAHLWTAAAALETALAHARRRQAATECTACGGESDTALCRTCTGFVASPCRYCNDPNAAGYCSDNCRRLDAANETTWRTR